MITMDVQFASAQPLGIGLQQTTDGTPVVATVEKTSAAVRVPLGSKVVMINGVNVAAKSKDEVMMALKAAKASGPSIAVTFDIDPAPASASVKEEQPVLPAPLPVVKEDDEKV